jgi:hypothetical protein
VNRAAVNRHAEEALRRELKPGEHVAASAAVTSNPSRWGAAAFLALALAMAAAGLATLFGQPGPLTGGPVIGLALPVLALGIQFLPRPMYVAVTGQRVICCRLSRLRSAPRRLAFGVPLADLRIVKYRSGRYGGSTPTPGRYISADRSLPVPGCAGPGREARNRRAVIACWASGVYTVLG